MQPDADHDSSTPAPGRRAVLTAAGGTVALGILAAASGCGARDGDAGGASPTTVPAPAGPGSAGTALGPAAEIPVGGGTVFDALEVVVTQPAAGEFRGFSAVCTHTGCIVDRVADGLIQCPCHGSRYNLDGTVAAGPAPRALSGRPVTILDGRVVLS